MKKIDLLLAKHGKKKKTHTHHGKIFKLNKNPGWCSGSISIQCFKGNRVHVAFGMDTYDREVMSWVASIIETDSPTINDRMVEWSKERFRKNKIPHRTQWLSSYRLCYTSHRAIYFSRIRTTPSCKINLMAEVLVETIKRGYVWFIDSKDAPTLMGQLRI